MNVIHKLVVAAILAGSLSISPAQVGGTWTGQGTGSTNLNWSNPNNWFSGTSPTVSDKVYFEDIFFAGYTNVFGAVNNVVDQNMNVATLYYTAYSFILSGNTNFHWYTTQIPAGKTLTVGGFGAAAATFAVGDIPGESGWVNSSYSNYVNIVGRGALILNDTNGTASIGGGTSGSILDMSTLPTFTATLDRFWVGANRDNPYSIAAFGRLWLAQTNVFTMKGNAAAYPSVLFGSSYGGGASGNPHVILGAVTTINADAVTVAGARANGAVVTFTNNTLSTWPSYAGVPDQKFLTNSGTFKIRGADGISRAALFSLNDTEAIPDYYGPMNHFTANAVGYLDLRNGIADIYVDKMIFGRVAPEAPGYTNTPGAGTSGQMAVGKAQLMWDNGTIDANNVWMCVYDATNAVPGGPAGAPLQYATAQLNGNAVWNIQNNLYQSQRTNHWTTSGSSFASTVLWVNDNARVNIGGNLIYQDGTWNPNLTNCFSSNILSGGVINMVNGGIAQFNFLFGSGTVSNASQIQIGGSAWHGSTPGYTLGTVNPGAQVIPGGVGVGTINLYSNVVFTTNGTLTFDLGAVTNKGGTINDFIDVRGDLTCSSNPVVINAYQGTLQAGRYRLIDYSGSLIGNLVYTNQSRGSVTLDTNTPGQIQLNVASYPIGNIKYVGPTDWDNTHQAIWSNASPVLALDYFHPGDSVVFDDSAANTNLVVSDTVVQGGMLFSNSVNTLFVRNGVGVGLIAGTGGLTKNGAGSVYLIYSGNNSWTGDVNINAGKIRINNASTGYAFGQGTRPVNIANGAAVEFASSGIGSTLSAGSGLRPINFSGSGPDGFGVFQGLTGNSSSFSPAWTLTGDAILTATNGSGLNLQGIDQATTPIANTWNLNGFNQTIQSPDVAANSAAGPVQLSWLAITNTSGANGNIILGDSSAVLKLFNCTVEGAGTIQVGTNMLVLGGIASLRDSASTLGYVRKALSFANGALASGGAGPYEFPVNGPISIDGMLTISNAQPFRIGGVISGTAGSGLTKLLASNLTLNAVNTYTGPTLVREGTLSLGGAGSIANSPFLYFALGTTFDTTGTAGTFTLAPGQGLFMGGATPADTTIRGSVTVGSGAALWGAATINGNLTLAGGGEIAPGGTNNQGQFVVNGNVSLKGGHFTWDVSPSFAGSDGLVVNGNLDISTAAGVTNIFTIGSIGGFSADRTNTLITYTGTLTTNAAGALTGLIQVNPDVGYALKFLDPATTPGKIQVFLQTAPGNLVWSGTDATHPSYWDFRTTYNWTNVGSILTNFSSGDYVTFDQSAATFTADLTNSPPGTTGKPLSPGSITITNASYTFQGLPGILSSSLLVSNAANLVISNRSDNLFIGDGLIVASGSSVTFNQPTNVTLAADLRGAGTINKSATTNDLQINGDATDFGNHYGTINVSAGQISPVGSNSIAGIVNVSAGATFNVYGQAVPGAQINVQGTGWDGLGALNNRSAVMGTNFPPYTTVGAPELVRASWISNCLTSVYLTGDTTIGADGSAWSISGLAGNNFNLIKQSSDSPSLARDVWIGTGSDTGLSNIVVLGAGRLVFARPGTGLGANGAVYVGTGATIGFAATNYPPTFGTYLPYFFPVTKPIYVTNGTIEIVDNRGLNASPTGTLSGPIWFTNNLTLNLDKYAYLDVFGNISNTVAGPAANNGLLQILGGRRCQLLGTNGYNTNTWLVYGSLVITNALAIPTNTWIIVSNTAAGASINMEPELDLNLGGNLISNRTLSLSAGNASPVTLSGDAVVGGALFLNPALLTYNQGRAAYYFVATGSGLDFTETNNTFANTNVFLTNIVSGVTNISNPISPLGGTYDFTGPKLRFRSGLRLANPPITTNLTPAVVRINNSVRFDGTNDWNTMQVDGGVTIGTDDALPPGAPITSKSGSLSIDLNGYNQTLSSYKPYQPMGAGNIQVGVGGQATIWNGSTNSDSTFTFDGARSYTGKLSTNCWDLKLADGSTHILGLTVASGVLEMLGTNTYSGPTLVTGGKLLVGGSLTYLQGLFNPTPAQFLGVLPSTTTLTVTNSGAFGGNGQVNCPVTIRNGGVFVPGECLDFTRLTDSQPPRMVTRTGRLTFGGSSLTLEPGSTALFCVDNATGTNATVYGIGTLTYGGTLVVSNLSNLAYTNGQVIKLFNAATYGGAFSTVKVWGASSVTNHLLTDGAITIGPATSTAPVSMTSLRTDKNHLTLSWPADHLGWRLQIQTNSMATGLTNNSHWIDCDNGRAINSTNIPIGNTNVFFRLTYP